MRPASLATHPCVYTGSLTSSSFGLGLAPCRRRASGMDCSVDSGLKLRWCTRHPRVGRALISVLGTRPIGLDLAPFPACE
eukprot:8455807-Alexandrium_andersonii.AAC.1